MELKNGYREWLKPGESLSQRAFRGGIWVFAIRITYRVIGLVRTIILARVLAPNDFGLMGIALLTMATLETFSQIGFNAALIQKKRKTYEYLDTAWTTGIIRSVLITAILFFSAPLVAKFFSAPPAVPILKVIGLAIILQSLINIAVIYFEKELEFHKYFAYQFTGMIVDVAVAISAAFLLHSVWALVYGFLAGNLTRCVLSYVIDPYRPKFHLNFSKVKELWGFGRWIFGSGILTFIYSQGDDIFVGILLGATALGFYQMAYRISNIPATEITHVISQVSFPIYSKLQDNISKLREAYLKFLQVTAFLSFPVAGLIFILAPDFTKLFLGEKWMPMVPVMQTLTIWGLIRSVGATTGPLFLAVGRPDLVTKLQLVKFILLVILIYPLTVKWGILGTSLAVVINALIENPIADYVAIKTIKCRILEFGKMLIVPMLAVSVMLSVLILLKYMIFEGMGFLIFFVLVAVGIVVYLAVIQIVELLSSYGIKATILNQIATFRADK